MTKIDKDKTIVSKKLSVNMHCASCAIAISKKLNKNCLEVNANPSLEIVKVKYNPDKNSIENIISDIKDLGYDAKEIE